jgi:hypothetical protein
MAQSLYRIHRPFKSPKCQPLATRRLQNESFDYHLDHAMRPEDDFRTEFETETFKSNIGVICLFPSVPLSQVIKTKLKKIFPLSRLKS